MQYKCQICHDTGNKEKDMGGAYLNCIACSAATDRVALEAFLDKLPAIGDYDAAWLVHQRALAIAPKQEAPKGTLPKWIDDQKGKDPGMDDLIEHMEMIYANYISLAAPAVDNGALTDERAAFEAWSESKWKYDLHPAREGTADTYMEGETETAWMAWEARAALSGAKGN